MSGRCDQTQIWGQCTCMRKYRLKFIKGLTNKIINQIVQLITDTVKAITKKVCSLKFSNISEDHIYTTPTKLQTSFPIFQSI